MIQRTAEIASISSASVDSLAGQEDRISNAKTQLYAEIGDALRIIRDGRLYSRSHATFEEYCLQRWDITRTHADRMIAAAEFAGSLTPIGVKPIAESQVRPILQLPKAERESAWKEAVETAPNGKVTAKHVQTVVDRRKPDVAPSIHVEPPPRIHVASSSPHAEVDDEEIDAWDAAIAATTPAPKLEQQDIRPKTSVINGVAAADPPDVARLRAAGKIGSGVVVEVTEPDGEPEVEPEPEIDAASLSDDEWLATLPLYGVLSNSPLRTFSRDALVYRHLEKPRAAYRYHAARVLNADNRKQGAAGAYAYRVSAFLRLEHPKNWLRCPTMENGGCGGTGQILAVGECPKCRGRGYWIA